MVTDFKENEIAEMTPETLIARNDLPSQANKSEETQNQNGKTKSYWAEASTLRKTIRTVALVLVWTCMGAFMEINGPTLKDLIMLIGSNYAEVTGSFSGRSVGKFLGAVMGGFLTDRFCRFCDCIIGVSLLIAGICIACVPYVRNTDIIWLLYLVLGTCMGCIDIAGQRTVLIVWLEKAASPMHIIHLGYGMGAFIAPLIANPFLADMRTYTLNVTNNGTTDNSSGLVSSTEVKNAMAGIISSSRIQYAYFIVAIITIVTASLFFIYQCKAPLYGKAKKSLEQSGKKKDTKRKYKDIINMLNPASCADGSFCFGAIILGFVFLKYFVYTACDRSVGLFIRSYAIDQLNFSKDDGSYLNTIYWIFYMVGRFVTFIAARWISIKVIMIVESVFSVGVGIGLCTAGTYSQFALWLLTGMAGFGIGPMFPTGFAWSNLHVEMTGLAMTWVLLGSSFGGLVLLKTAGRAYEYFGPTAFVFIFLALISATFCTDIILTVISLSMKYNRKNEIKHGNIDNDLQNETTENSREKINDQET